MAQRAWMFTLNNPTEDSVPVHPNERYIVYQLEQGEQGTSHYQGYIELKKPARLAAMKKWLPRAHFEPRRGTPEQARDYCMKAESRVTSPVERGQFGGNQGERTDLQIAADKIKAGSTVLEIAQEHPDLYVKYHRGFTALRDAMQVFPRDEGFVPRSWQAEVLKIVSGPVDERKILWIYDSEGNTGKSRLVRNLCAEHGGVVLSGKVVDMAYQYNSERVVCFDITRTQAQSSDHLYSMAESLKNGILVSSKYESKMKRFSTPHVIFFSNSLPSFTAWSKDRYQILELTSENFSFKNIEDYQEFEFL